MKIKISVLALLVCSSTAFAEIRETNNMSDAFANLGAKDVVVLDIDNTILEPAQTLGSDQWYGYTFEKYKATGVSKDCAIDLAIWDWVRVQNVTTVKAVDKLTPYLVKSAQEKKVRVMALSARPASLIGATLRQLKSVGIELDSGDLTYSDNDAIELSHGVLFVGPRNNKGLVLADFFQKMGVRPTRLIFVDDKVGHVTNMDAVFAKAEFPNINYRYGAADETVKAFSPAIAEVEWRVFSEKGRLISDEEARK